MLLVVVLLRCRLLWCESSEDLSESVLHRALSGVDLGDLGLESVDSSKRGKGREEMVSSNSNEGALTSRLSDGTHSSA